MNFDALLAPISDAAPSGEDLSYSPDFDAIEDMRRADDPTLDQGEWVSALKLADWPGVVARCERVLAERSKDLRVAAWLTDAVARTEGFGGLADGLLLCRLLCERFWDDLHPQIDAGDMEERSGSLRWLLTQVEVITPTLPVLKASGRSFSIREMESAQAATPRAERPADGSQPPPATQEDIAAARRATPREFLAANADAAQRAQLALAALQAVIDARITDDGPSFAGARKAIEDALHTVKRLGGDVEAPVGRGGAAAESVAEATAAGEVPNAAAGSAPQPVGLRTRAQAIQQLRAVAEFFRRTEPHSPVAYLVDRAAKWGEMPLHTWLRTVLKDAGSISQIEELLGVETPKAAE